MNVNDMTVYDLFPSNYVRADDLPPNGIVVTIKRLETEEMRSDHSEKTEQKTVVYFEKAKKGLVLNKTNGFIIAELYGKALSGWIGQRIELYPTQVKAFGKVTDAIRIRKRRFSPQTATPTSAVEAAPLLDAPEDVLDYEEDIDFGGTPHDAELPVDNPFEDDQAPDPVAVAFDELAGQPLNVVLTWAEQHSDKSRDELGALWNAARKEQKSRQPETLAAFVRTVLMPVAA